ncbi:transposase, partial [uncultured Proteiniphilum sp.]|uniref:IS66 family transposase n=1 Tax=uncultured Proteiniphilum sp. TaxID=497637 RepID=UPI003451005F
MHFAIFSQKRKRTKNPSLTSAKRYAKIYRVEEQAREEKMSFEERHQLRFQLSKPAMEELKQWLEEQRGQALSKSPIGIAVAYTLNIWDRLERTMTDGKFEIDNNKFENKIRKLARGRLCAAQH